MLPLRGEASEQPTSEADATGFPEAAAERGLLDAAIALADASSQAVVTLWPHPPARASLLALPDWAVAVVVPAFEDPGDPASAFLHRNMHGKAVATFAARAVAVTEALRTADLALLRFALEDRPLVDLLGARIPGLQPALHAAREHGVAAALSRIDGRPCIAVLHPETDTAATAAEAVTERLMAHALRSTTLLTRLDSAHHSRPA